MKKSILKGIIEFLILFGIGYLIGKFLGSTIWDAQILLHNGKEFDLLVSKLDNKIFKLKLEEVKKWKKD